MLQFGDLRYEIQPVENSSSFQHLIFRKALAGGSPPLCRVPREHQDLGTGGEIANGSRKILVIEVRAPHPLLQWCKGARENPGCDATSGLEGEDFGIVPTSWVSPSQLYRPAWLKLRGKSFNDVKTHTSAASLLFRNPVSTLSEEISLLWLHLLRDLTDVLVFGNTLVKKKIKNDLL